MLSQKRNNVEKFFARFVSKCRIINLIVISMVIWPINKRFGLMFKLTKVGQVKIFQITLSAYC